MQTYYKLNDFLEGMRKDVDGEFYYEIKNDGIYKIEFSHAGKKGGSVFEYKFYPELNNKFKEVEALEIYDIDKGTELFMDWFSENNQNIEIMTKEEVKNFLDKNVIEESNSCWKNPKQLAKAIKNGLEVPNCIPDEKYALKESNYFIGNKKRELNKKYEKIMDWLEEVVESGDKDYAEKIMKIIEKWKKSYEDKIRNAKSYLRENKDIKILDLKEYITKNETAKNKISSFIKNYGN
jgi:hypothetical protein